MNCQSIFLPPEFVVKCLSFLSSEEEAMKFGLTSKDALPFAIYVILPKIEKNEVVLTQEIRSLLDQGRYQNFNEERERMKLISEKIKELSHNFKILNAIKSEDTPLIVNEMMSIQILIGEYSDQANADKNTI